MSEEYEALRRHLAQHPKGPWPHPLYQWRLRRLIRAYLRSREAAGPLSPQQEVP